MLGSFGIVSDCDFCGQCKQCKTWGRLQELDDLAEATECEINFTKGIQKLGKSLEGLGCDPLPENSVGEVFDQLSRIVLEMDNCKKGLGDNLIELEE